MIVRCPTPARASKLASADPVAPHPTIATRASASMRCPSTPIGRNSICLEYRSSDCVEVSIYTVLYGVGKRFLPRMRQSTAGLALGGRQPGARVNSEWLLPNTDSSGRRGLLLRRAAAVLIALVFAMALWAQSAPPPPD